jgi:hypothetical protein
MSGPGATAFAEEHQPSVFGLRAKAGISVGFLVGPTDRLRLNTCGGVAGDVERGRVEGVSNVLI